jgi:high-mobility group nucleosome-binding domain-containing protein 2
VTEPRKRRRVRTDPVPGSDPTPQERAEAVRATEDAEETWGDRAEVNDARLKADKPPHY